MKKQDIFRILMMIIAVYHVSLGLVALFLPAELQTEVFRLAFGAGPEMSPDVLLAARFTSSYVIAFGLLAGLTGLKPDALSSVVPLITGLFGLRMVNRLFVFGTLSEQYGVSTARNVTGVLLLLILCASTWLTRPRKEG